MDQPEEQPNPSEEPSPVEASSELASPTQPPPEELGEEYTIRRQTLGWTLIEIAAMVAVFFLFAGWLPPGVNEAHYLAKAKHYWQPDWLAGDFFLESGDAHTAFYWFFGWITLWVPLPAAAWIGRLLTWTLIAFAWQRLSFSLAPHRCLSVLSAALVLLLLQQGNLAGEWLIGGVEAKGFAFCFLFLALDAVVNKQWRIVWIFIGLAAAFHVLVGGWGGVAVGFAWLLIGNKRETWLKMLPFIGLGIGISMIGLAPALALTWGSDPEMVRQANYIYVFERLPHHLTIRQMGTVEWFGYEWLSPFILRHAALASLWLALVVALRKEKKLFRLQAFVAGAVVIAIVGLVIDVSTLNAPDTAARLLRFYWFRMSDVSLPIGISLALAVTFHRLQRSAPPLSQYLLLWMLFCAGMGIYWENRVRWQDVRSDADRQTLPADPNDAERTAKIHQDWLVVCHWISQHTPRDAVFITPRSQQTFKWYAQRCEVANWKDVPQDAANIMAWKHRHDALFPRDPNYPDAVVHQGFTANSPERMKELVNEFEADYIIVDRNVDIYRPPFRKVYPPANQRWATYEVYKAR